MKLIEIARAYMAIEKLADEKLPLKVSYGLSRIMDKLEKPFTFYANKEMELIRTYKPAEQEGTMIRFGNKETAAEFNQAHLELDEIEENVEIKPVEIDVNISAGISLKDLRELQKRGVVKITGGDEDGGQRSEENCSCGRHGVDH